MPMISGQLALAAGAQRLSNLYGGASLGDTVSPAQDVPLRQVLLTADGADAFVGATSAVTSTAYGTKVDSAENVPVSIGPFNSGGIKLSDIWVAGAGATLHVTGIVF
jgi:hypothetical protein